jgi:hypothetical protein
MLAMFSTPLKRRLLAAKDRSLAKIPGEIRMPLRKRPIANQPVLDDPMRPYCMGGILAPKERSRRYNAPSPRFPAKGQLRNFVFGSLEGHG